MVSLDQIQAYVRDRIEEDKEKRFVNVSGSSLQDALEQASIELGIPVKKIDYEVLERGSRGVLGMGKKPFLLLAYPAQKKAADKGAAEDVQVDMSLLARDADADRDGEAFVRLTPDGIMLKVTKPIGSGRRATERQAIEKLLQRVDDDFDKQRVSRVVKLAQGEFIKVGDFRYDPMNDASLTVEVADGEMTGYLYAYPPGEGGADPAFEDIVAFLRSEGIVDGLDEEAVMRFCDDPAYRERVKVAAGILPVNGADAFIKYTFETEPGQVQLKETNGRVDFKELNLVQNVVEGQVLAKKIPAQRGEPGRTVTGKLLPASDGKDTDLQIGKNVRMGSDGLSALAEINGQVTINAGKIVVEPIHIVNGDVNLRSGNVHFLGSVIVKGSVDDGFTVKAAGNIEVMGSVGKSTLDAEGDVIVHQGVAGKSTGVIRSDRSVWAKFIENARVEAGDLVVVSDGIIASTVLSDRKIICKGRRASIVGGKLRAVEEIDAKTLGSVAGSETVLEVGYDPKRKERLAAIEEQRDEYRQQLEEINLNMSTIQNLVRSGRTVPAEKKAYYQELKARKVEIADASKKLDAEREEIHDYLADLKVSGKISASGTVFPGVKVSIKDAFLEVRNEFKFVTFVAENSTVKVTKYEESDEDLSFSRRG